MSKKKPCGLDYCPQEEIVGAYASCSACAWGNGGDDESEEKAKGSDDYERAIEQMEHDMLYEPTYNPEDGSM